MIDAVKSTAKQWLASKKVDMIFGLKEQDGDIVPYLFTKEDELDSLALSTQHRINSVCRPSNKNIMTLIQGKEPNARIGIIARGCDERALIEMAKRNQIDISKFEILGVTCTKADAEECLCDRPYPGNIAVGEKVEGVSKNAAIEALLGKSLEERAAFWKHQLDKCIKCYGCRNACPECFCQDCKMEQKLWAETGQLPPEFPMFHFIRFLHLADRCIGCGACERACPMDIPLLTIFKQMKKDVKDLFNYDAGVDLKQESPLLTTLDETPIKEEAASAKV